MALVLRERPGSSVVVGGNCVVDIVWAEGIHGVKQTESVARC